MTDKSDIEYYVWLLGEYKRFEKLVKRVIDVKQGIDSYNLLIDFDDYYADEPCITVTYDYDECAEDGKYIRNSCCGFSLTELFLTDKEIIEKDKENTQQLMEFVNNYIRIMNQNKKKEN